MLPLDRTSVAHFAGFNIQAEQAAVQAAAKQAEAEAEATRAEAEAEVREKAKAESDAWVDSIKDGWQDWTSSRQVWPL